jgi:lysophospholipase L1-like esterase
MKTIACMGDSITANTTSESYVNYWQRLCDDVYGKLQVEIHGAGVNGETAFDGLQRLERDVLEYKPDLVTVCYGHNEVHSGVLVTDYQINIERIISQIYGIGAELWLLTPTQIADLEMASRYIPYLDSLKEIAAKRGCPLLDLWKIFEGHDLKTIFTYKFDYDGLIGTDYLHPNEVGAQIIARRLMDELQTVI